MILIVLVVVLLIVVGVVCGLTQWMKPARVVSDPSIIEVPTYSWTHICLDKQSHFIGEGGFGIVVRGTFKDTTGVSLKVAIKIFCETTVVGCRKPFEEIKELVKSEALIAYSAAMKMKSNNIVEVYGLAVGQLAFDISLPKNFKLKAGSDAIGIIMRLEEGGSVEDLIYNKNRTVSPKLKVRILASVARGLTELHEMGIHHGDLKPANLLLSDYTDNPSVRISDFGLSEQRKNFKSSDKSFSTKVSTASNYNAGGTVRYKAPELVQNPYHKMSIITGRERVSSSSPHDHLKTYRPSRKTDILSLIHISEPTRPY